MSFENLEKPVVTLYHSNLSRLNEETAYKSKCPFCKDGALLLLRNQKTLELQSVDMCVLCAQRVIYADIEELRKRERFNES